LDESIGQEITRNKWTWGQYCPLKPVDDLNKLLQLAKQERTFLNGEQ